MDFLELKLATKEQMLKLTDNAEYIDFHLKYGPAYCVYYKAGLVGAAGLDLVRESVANAWFIMDRQFKPVSRAEYVLYLDMWFWAAKEMGDILMQRFGLKKIRARCDSVIKGSGKFLIRCGFERTGKRNLYIFKKDK